MHPNWRSQAGIKALPGRDVQRSSPIAFFVWPAAIAMEIDCSSSAFPSNGADEAVSQTGDPVFSKYIVKTRAAGVAHALDRIAPGYRPCPLCLIHEGLMTASTSAVCVEW